MSPIILRWVTFLCVGTPNPTRSPQPPPPPRESAKLLGRKIKSMHSIPIIAMMYSLASNARFCRCAQAVRGLPGRRLQSRRNVGNACCRTPWQGSAHTKAPVESLSAASFPASLLSSHTLPVPVRSCSINLHKRFTPSQARLGDAFKGILQRRRPLSAISLLQQLKLHFAS